MSIWKSINGRGALSPKQLLETKGEPIYLLIVKNLGDKHG